MLDLSRDTYMGLVHKDTLNGCGTSVVFLGRGFYVVDFRMTGKKVDFYYYRSLVK